MGVSSGGLLFVNRLPWPHIATTLSTLLCFITFASYLDTVLDAQQDTRPINRYRAATVPHRHAVWAISCSDRVQVRWGQLERDPGSAVAALYSEADTTSIEEQRYLLLLIHSMQGMGYSVTYYHAQGAQLRHQAQLLRLGQTLGISLDAAKLRAGPWVHGAPSVRFFVYSGRGPHPRLTGIGLVNVFHSTAGNSNSDRDALKGHSPSGAAADPAGLARLLAYDHVLFSSTAAYRRGMQQLQDSLQRADAEARVMPSLDPLPPALSFATYSPPNQRHVHLRRHILSVAKDQFESLQALGVFARMQAAGQLANSTRLLLLLRHSHSQRDNARLLQYIAEQPSLAAAVWVLPYSTIDQAAVDPVVMNQTLAQWHLTGRRAYDHAGCGPAVVEGMLRGFIPVSTCGGGGVREVIGHGTSGYLADSLDEVGALTAALLGLPLAGRQHVWNATVERGRSYTYESFQVTMEKVEGRGIASRSFRHLIATTLPAVRACATAKVSRDAANAAVILEARSHYALEYVILNAMAILARSSQPWSLHIYATEENQWLVSRLTSDPRLANAHVHSLQHTNSSVAAYNSLLKTPEFWQRLRKHAEKVLIFQTDSLLLGDSIDEYMRYDYIGAPWHTDNERWPEISKQVPPGVGNGGLSLRTVQAMVDIATHSPSTDGEQEDLYFARNVYSRNASRLGPRLHAYQFGQEVPCYDLDPLMHQHPFSIHAAWYYMPLTRTQRLLEQAYAASVRVPAMAA